MKDILQSYPEIFHSLALLMPIIVFLQSGLDKITDWSGNLSWLKGHFSKTPFRNLVPLLLAKLCFLEILTGMCGLAALVQIWFLDAHWLSEITFGLSMLTTVFLFLGQRIAKDYAGAATLVGYLVYFAVVGILLPH